MLGAAAAPVFSKRAVLRPAVRAEDAGRDQCMVRSWRVLRAVGGRRQTVGSTETRRKGANASEADREADVRDAPVGRAKQGRGTLQAAGEQVRMRRFAERSPELAAEMSARESRCAGQVVNPQRLDVARVGDIFRSEQVPGRWDEDHPSSIAAGPRRVSRC
jgi:hypothetical protein